MCGSAPPLSPLVVGGKESKVQQHSRRSHGAVFESNLKSFNKVKHSEKICSVFGGYLMTVNFCPKKMGVILSLFLNSGKVLTPM